MLDKGVFIVLEGSDGSGKTTQFEILKERLRATGYQVEVFDFPRYGQPSSYFVQKYLNGGYGEATAVSPYKASLFFALDRFGAADDIRRAKQSGKVVLSNRYAGSNMAHQGAKFATAVEKRSFFVWEDSLEYQLLNLPRPDINLYLRVPAEISHSLIGRKAARSYTDKSHDQHETDIDYLKKAVGTYDLLCQLFPADFKMIDCTQDGRLLDIANISNKIWQSLQPLLPPAPRSEKMSEPPPLEAASQTVQAPVRKQQTPVTDDRLVVKQDRLSLLAASFLRQLADASVSVGSHSWSGQSANHDYYLPEGLSSELAQKYQTALEQAIRNHQQLYNRLIIYFGRRLGLSRKVAARQAQHLVDLATPVSATASVTLKIAADKALAALQKLEASRNPELLQVADQLRQQVVADETAGTEQAASPPESLQQILAKLGQLRPVDQNGRAEDSRLLEASPRNEFDLLTDKLFNYSELPRNQLLAEVAKLPYVQKSTSLKEAISDKNSALELVRYRLDIVTSRQRLDGFLDDKSIKIQQARAASPRYGYEVSAVIEEAGAEDDYLEIFDSFLGLYSLLQTELQEAALEYATLMGHKLRWQTDLSGMQLAELSTKDTELYAQLVSLIGEVHPLIGDYLTGKSKLKPTANRPKRAKSRK